MVTAKGAVKVNPPPSVAPLGDRNMRRGRKLGMLGNTIGLASAYSGITYSLVYGDLGGLQAGLWFWFPKGI